MFADYTNLVHQDYLRKRSANTLPLSLVHPTPAKLKRESLVVCTERYQRRDEKALKLFFGEGADREACLKAIKGCERDKFIPLRNFLDNEIDTTNDKNIELLAWLIDFKDRPYELGKKYDTDSADKSAIQQEHSQTSIEVKGEPPPERSGPNEQETISDQTVSDRPVSSSKTRRTIILALILTVIGITTYVVWNNKPSRTYIPGDGACMYWTGDHYQQIPCNQKIENAIVIALDSEKLTNFKKITDFNTITYASIGSLWYTSIHGNLEIFTSQGFHPVHSEIKLKPLTDYMFRIHIHPLKEAIQVSN